MDQKQITGRITGIKRYEIHDGPGVRTTVFLKGCPLRCKWCHNPENLVYEKQIGFYNEKCIRCGACVSVCGNVHSIFGNQHVIDERNCTFREACVKICPRDALTVFGQDILSTELVKQLVEDLPFYVATGGGVTLSGGEPLLQADFSAAVLASLKEEGINTAVDTCLYAGRDSLDKVVPYTDCFLVDIKAMNSELHKNLTGADNAPILKNIEYLDGLGKTMEIRIPYIPQTNDGEIAHIAEYITKLKHVSGVKVLAYHNLSEAKYQALKIDYALPDVRIPGAEEIEAANRILHSYGISTVSV